jgi:NADPH2:quinone reductase
LKGCSIIGVFYGEHGTRSPHEQRELVAELVEMLRAGRINPSVSAQFSLDQAPLALRELMDRKVIGKAVVMP